jgi:hypothetical protein
VRAAAREKEVLILGMLVVRAQEAELEERMRQAEAGAAFEIESLSPVMRRVHALKLEMLLQVRYALVA